MDERTFAACMAPRVLPEGSCRGWGVYGAYVQAAGSPAALRVDRADPWSSLSAEEIRVLHEHPEIGGAAVTLRGAGENCPAGDMLTLNGVNRHVVYRLTEPLGDSGDWIMKWPD